MSEPDPAAARSPGSPLPSMWRVALLVASFALRRSLNRLFAQLRPRKDAAGRRATARKRPIGRTLVVVFGCMFIANGLLQSTRIVHELARHAERTAAGERVIVSPFVMQGIDHTETRQRALDQAEDFLRRSRELLRQAFELEASARGLAGERASEWVRRALLRADARGRAGFRSGGAPRAPSDTNEANETNETNETGEREDAPLDVQPVTADLVEDVARAAASVREAQQALERARRELRREFDGMAGDDTRLDASAVTARAEQLMHVFEHEGRAGFSETRLAPFAALPSPRSWFGPRDAPAMLQPLGLLALMLAVAVALFCSTAGDLAKVEWSLEWWFTFPVPARGLMLARAIETAAHPVAWVLLAPFLFVVFWCAGLALWALPLALLGTAYVGLLAGGCRVVLETGLRRHLSLANVARVQALLSVVGVLLIICATASVLPEWLYLLAEVAAHPGWHWVNRFLPIGWAAGGREAWLAGVGCAAVAGIAVFGAVSLGGWWVRDGLATGTGPHQGRRTRRAPALASGAHADVAARANEPPGGWNPGSVWRKELLLLFRDRRLLAQVAVLPVVIVGVQLVVNRRLADMLAHEPRHAAAAAFAAASLTLATGACSTLAMEVQALWVYFTVPRSLPRLLVDKAVFWSVLACGVGLSAFVIITRGDLGVLWAGAPALGLVVIGLVVNAFTATALGVLGTDAFETEPQRRVGVPMIYLYMLIASLFAYALYVPSWWAKFVHVVLSGLLAYALWQKVQDHAPLLLDPQARPEPDIAVADGLIATLVFFVFQGLCFILLSALEYAPGVSLAFAFATAGLLTAATTLFVLWRHGVPKLSRRVGFAAPSGGWGRGLGLGLAGGLLGALVAVGYLVFISQFEVLRQLRDESLALSPAESPELLPWLGATAVLAAPLFEEFIFRGLLYAGFRRSLGALRGVLASSAVFALVHPAIATPPVFVLGCIAAASYERTRSLVTPITVHMAYNACVVGLGFLDS